MLQLIRLNTGEIVYQTKKTPLKAFHQRFQSVKCEADHSWTLGWMCDIIILQRGAFKWDKHSVSTAIHFDEGNTPGESGDVGKM